MHKREGCVGKSEEVEEKLGSIRYLRLESEPVAMETPPEGGAMEIGSSGTREREGGGDV